tara:strand:- start:54 stop:530 length:477 start_codon:yes stop_codon:yes gene_type:complete
MTSDGSGTLTLNNAALKNTPSFSAKLSSGQIISASTFTKVQFDNEQYDTDNKYDTSNYRFTPTISGVYHINALIMFANLSGTGNLVKVRITKNGSYLTQCGDFAMTTTGSADPIWTTAIDVQLNTTDYIEVEAFQNTGGGVELDTNFSYFSGYRLIGA